MKRVALICAVLLLSLAPAAQAWTPPGDRPANNALVNRAVAVAEGFWHSRGVNVCPQSHLDVRLASDLSGGIPGQYAYGRGQLDGCRVWFLTSLVASAQGQRPGNEMAVYLCRTAVIEIGHTGGLDDAYGTSGVMDPAASYRRGTPWACREWARR